MALPQHLQGAVDLLLGEMPGVGRRTATENLSRAYRAGETSQGIDFGAYLATRLPATYAAASLVLAEVRRLVPDFAPQSMIDAGSGPGTASWAALTVWPEVVDICLVDRDPAFLELARQLATGHPTIGNATAIVADLSTTLALPSVDLVTVAYALAEIPQSGIDAAVINLWERADVLVLIEPGTPAGFARIAAARRLLLQQGALVVGPCPHGNACPMMHPNWCHFAVRLARSRAHMHAKSARVPFEDEKFSWLAVRHRQAAVDHGVLPSARVIAPPRSSKGGVELDVCTPAGLERRTVRRRDRDAYRKARKLRWGGAF
jgi:ribosomal protein RSM22 (predicted rRNA methylase)